MDLAQTQIVQAIMVKEACGDLHFPSGHVDRLFWLANSSSLSLLSAAANRLVRITKGLGANAQKSRGDTDALRLVRLCEMHLPHLFAARSLSVKDDLVAAIADRHALVHETGSPEGMRTDEQYASLLRCNIGESHPANLVGEWELLQSRPDPTVEGTQRMIARLIRGYEALIEFGNFVFFIVVEPQRR